MITRDVIRRLRAFQVGKPLPCGETKRVHVAEDRDVLIVSFVRMGGESRPWGIAFGRPGKRPVVLTVPEARNRDLVAEIAREFAESLLAHLRHPSHSRPAPCDWNDLQPLRQIWLPNETHLDMLHHLAFAYTWTKHGGSHRSLLNALGRACGWLFRESQRPGQMAVMVAARVLRESYTFPAEDVRQSHLGYLLAWLETAGHHDRRLAAAAEAERHSMATGLDPTLERDRLEPLVRLWEEADRNGELSRKNKLRKEIHEVLHSELERRWSLVERGLSWMRGDNRRTNAGVGQLVAETVKEQWFQFARLELQFNDEADGPAFFPSVETDRHPAVAASRYLVHQASADLLEALLVHDDRELLAEAIANGDAFDGTILGVRDDGTGRTTRPVWRIIDRADRQLRLRPGSQVAAVGFRERTAVIRRLDETNEGHRVIEVEITGRKTNRNPGPGLHALQPTSGALVGCEVAFVSAPADGISRRKSSLIWQQNGPGAWLTHQIPSASPGAISDDDRDDAPVVDKALKSMKTVQP